DRFVDNIPVEQGAKDPISLQVGGEIKDEANSEQQTVTQDQRDRKLICRRKWGDAFAVEGRQQCLRGENYTQTEESAQGKSVRLISEQCFQHKPISGPLKRRAKDQAIKQVEDPGCARSEVARSGVRQLGKANETSAVGESVGSCRHRACGKKSDHGHVS